MSADVRVPSDMGLVCGSTDLEAHTFSSGPNRNRWCHGHHMAFSADRASNSWAYLSRPSKRHRMGDRAGDDC